MRFTPRVPLVAFRDRRRIMKRLRWWLAALGFALLVTAGVLRGADEGGRELLLGLLAAGGAMIVWAGALRDREKAASAKQTEERFR